MRVKRIPSRSEQYRQYLQSDAWKRKRYVVMKRDKGKCRFCGSPATEVHHLKYAKNNPGREPIEYLVSVCKRCHSEINIAEERRRSR